jgi:hypothetical protein
MAGGVDFHWTGGEHGEDGEDDEMNDAAPSTCPSLNPCPTGQVARAARNTTLSPATARCVAAHACGVFVRAVYGRERGGGSTVRPRVHNDVYDVFVHRSIVRATWTARSGAPVRTWAQRLRCPPHSLFHLSIFEIA